MCERVALFLKVKMNIDDPIGWVFQLNTDVTSMRLRFFAPLTLRSRVTSWLSRSEGLISPSLSRKERGLGGEFRGNPPTAAYAMNATVFFIFFLALVAFVAVCNKNASK